MSVISVHGNGQFEVEIDSPESKDVASLLVGALGEGVCRSLKMVITDDGRSVTGEIDPRIEDPKSLLEVIAADAEITAIRPDIVVFGLGYVGCLSEISDNFDT